MLVREELAFVVLKTLITGGDDCKEKDTKLQIQAWPYNPINQEAKVEGWLQIQARLDYIVSSRTAWSTLQAGGQPGKHKTQSQNKITKQN